MAEIGLAAAMSGMYGKGEGQNVKHYYDKSSNKKGSVMACKTKKPGKK